MNRGRVRFSGQALASALFPGEAVTVLSIHQTEADRDSDMFSVLLQGEQFRPVPEGVEAPYYSCEMWRRYQNGDYVTTVKFT